MTPPLLLENCIPNERLRSEVERQLKKNKTKKERKEKHIHVKNENEKGKRYHIFNQESDAQRD